MPDQYDNFRNIVASSETLRKRWNSVTDAAIETAAREGIAVNREDLLTLDSIRTHVVSGDADTGIAWRDEAEAKLPAFTQKAESRRFLTTLKSNDADEKLKAEMDILKKNPAERMRIAREGGESCAGPVTTKKELTPEARAAAILEMDRIGLKGSARIQKARELGLD